MVTDKLILIITYKCDLNCRYCPTIKSNESMDFSTAQKAIDLFLDSENPKEIKLFGSEPLLEFELIKKIIDYIDSANKPNKINSKIKLLLTTNGNSLDDSKIKFLKEKKVELSLSIDGDLNTHLENRPGSEDAYKNLVSNREIKDSIVNVTITPNAACKLYKNFLYLYEKGFRKFNFLPEALAYWNESSLMELLENLEDIAKFKIEKHQDLLIKNCEVWNKTFFFNDGIVIDCNGEIYPNNLMLVGKFKDLKKKMKMGDINKIASLKKLKFLKEGDFDKMINSKLDKEIVMSHARIKEIMNIFVDLIILKDDFLNV